MARAAAIPPARPYRLPLFGAPERELRRGLQVAAVVGGAVLLAVYLAPVRAPDITDVDKVPERFARLILREPPAPPALPPVPAIRMPAPPKVVPKTPEAVTPVAPPHPAPRREATPKVAPDHGTAGRERAREQVAQLEKVTQSVDQVLADVSTSLASSDDGAGHRRRPSRRRARSGRSAAEVSGVGQIRTETGAAAAAIPGTRIELGSSTEAGVDAPRGTRGDGTAARSGEIRTDADLMAVVRKYAPALQFCYDNELKKSPQLGGKLVVSITVAASGHITDAAVVRDTVGSAAMVACALAQIEAWRFPAVPEGTVTFQAPFVFTPPE